MRVLRNILATLVGCTVGATIAVLSTIVVLEALHTKNGFVALFVPIVAIVAGSITGLRLRRALIGTSANAEQSQVDQP